MFSVSFCSVFRWLHTGATAQRPLSFHALRATQCDTHINLNTPPNTPPNIPRQCFLQQRFMARVQDTKVSCTVAPAKFQFTFRKPAQFEQNSKQQRKITYTNLNYKAWQHCVAFLHPQLIEEKFGVKKNLSTQRWHETSRNA